MNNIGIYKNNTITSLLLLLSHTISKYSKNQKKGTDTKVRTIIKEINTRTLTQTQKYNFRRSIDRFSWI